MNRPSSELQVHLHIYTNENQMFYHIEDHDSMRGDKLDDYLDKGWFRLKHRIDKGSHYMNLDRGELLRVIELRYDVNEVISHRSHKRIKRFNQDFRVEYSNTFEITAEDMVLYMNYYAHIDFDTSPDIEHVLSDNGKLDIFDTRCIRIYNGDEQIALGLYDMGTNSVASILNCYDPEYAKYSLGKYIMLLIIDMMKKAGMKYYYPGYLMSGNPKFDYKLFIGKEAAYHLNSESQWVRFEDEIMDYYELPFEDLLKYLQLYLQANQAS